MVTGLLAVLIAGHVVGSLEGGPGRGYPTYDRDYYYERGGYGGYDPCGGCGRGYTCCSGYRGYGNYGYGNYGSDYGYRSYGYGYGD